MLRGSLSYCDHAVLLINIVLPYMLCLQEFLICVDIFSPLLVWQYPSWFFHVLLAGPGSSKLGVRTTVAIVIARLVFVPPAGIGIVMLADKLGFLPAGDKMFRFVLLLQHSMPTSVLSGKSPYSSYIIAIIKSSKEYKLPHYNLDDKCCY